jgi:CMP-N-acetylneuraminic acid synthetase
MMDVFAVIPARSGSTRVPQKNIKKVGGKPLIAHTIEQSHNAKTIDRTIVSTDDNEIAAIADQYGGEVPFERPPELATDDASSLDVIEHALDWIIKTEGKPRIVAMLQVTTPLRTATDIDSAIQRLQHSTSAQSVVSVSEFLIPPLWSVKKNEDGFLTAYFEPDVLWKNTIPRSQDLPDVKHPNGAVFAATVDAFYDQHSFYTDRTLEYEMPPERSIDIDEPFELEIARALIRDE